MLIKSEEEYLVLKNTVEEYEEYSKQKESLHILEAQKLRKDNCSEHYFLPMGKYSGVRDMECCYYGIKIKLWNIEKL